MESSADSLVENTLVSVTHVGTPFTALHISKPPAKIFLKNRKKRSKSYWVFYDADPKTSPNIGKNYRESLTFDHLTCSQTHFENPKKISLWFLTNEKVKARQLTAK